MRKQPPRRKPSPEKKLQKEGGRTFVVGYTWVARLKGEQAKGSTEAEAAFSLLERLGYEPQSTTAG